MRSRIRPTASGMTDHADKGYLKGTSIRSIAFKLFAGVARAIGRRETVAGDYKTLCRFLFHRRDLLSRLGCALHDLGIAVIGLGLGAVIYFVALPR